MSTAIVSAKPKETTEEIYVIYSNFRDSKSNQVEPSVLHYLGTSLNAVDFNDDYDTFFADELNFFVRKFQNQNGAWLARFITELKLKGDELVLARQYRSDRLELELKELVQNGGVNVNKLMPALVNENEENIFSGSFKEMKMFFHRRLNIYPRSWVKCDCDKDECDDECYERSRTCECCSCACGD